MHTYICHRFASHSTTRQSLSQVLRLLVLVLHLAGAGAWDLAALLQLQPLLLPVSGPACLYRVRSEGSPSLPRTAVVEVAHSPAPRPWGCIRLPAFAASGMPAA